MQKTFIFILLLTLSPATMFCFDEFKEKTSGKQETSSEKTVDNKPTIEQNATVAFMITTVKPVAEMGDATVEKDFTTWANQDASRNQYGFCTLSDDVQMEPGATDIAIRLAKNFCDMRIESLPSNLSITAQSADKQRKYVLKANYELISLTIMSRTMLREKALFEVLQKKSKVKLTEITPESIKAADFLEKRYASYLALYSEAEKSSGKK